MKYKHISAIFYLLSTSQKIQLISTKMTRRDLRDPYQTTLITCTRSSICLPGSSDTGPRVWGAVRL